MSESDARQRSDKFFTVVNCSSTLDTDELLDCLRQLDAFFIRDNEFVSSEFMVIVLSAASSASAIIVHSVVAPSGELRGKDRCGVFAGKTV